MLQVITLVITIALSFVFSSPEIFALEINKSSSDWKTIAKSAWAVVLVEKKLYRKPDSERFFVHVRIDKTSDRTIGFNANKRFSLFYINQWGGSHGPHLDAVIEERRMTEPAISEAQSKELIDKFNSENKFKIEDNSQALSKVKPGKFFDYYIAFNNGSYRDIEKVYGSPFIKIVIDGYIVLTNGQKLQVIRRGVDYDQEAGEVFISAAQIPWGEIPSSAKVFEY